MERPNKKDYLTTNQIEYNQMLNKYYDDLEAYIDILEKQLTLTDVTTRFNVDKKIFKKHRSCVGIIRYKSDFGFNYWIVEWDNGNWSREYGLDLNVW